MSVFQDTYDLVALKLDQTIDYQLRCLFVDHSIQLSVSDFVLGGGLSTRLNRVLRGTPLFLGGVVGTNPYMVVTFGGLTARFVKENGVESVSGVTALALSIKERTAADLSIALSGCVMPIPDQGPDYVKADVWFSYVYKNTEKVHHVVVEGVDHTVREKVSQSVLLYLKTWLEGILV